MIVFFNADMGWQCKRKTNSSPSGIGSLVTAIRKKIIDTQVMVKSCSICARAKENNVSPPPHNCHVNHVGSSKSMEPAALALMAVRAPSLGYMLKTVAADDDSGIRKKLRYLSDDGVLPKDFYLPNFLADPSHRIKVFGKHVYKLKKAPLYVSQVRDHHAERIKKLGTFYLPEQE